MAARIVKKEHKPKLLSPDILLWGRGLPQLRRGGSTPGKSNFFLLDIPGFYWDIPAVPEKFEKKVGVRFSSQGFQGGVLESE